MDRQENKEIDRRIYQLRIHSRHKWLGFSYHTLKILCEGFALWRRLWSWEMWKEGEEKISSKVNGLIYSAQTWKTSLTTDYHWENLFMWSVKVDTNLMAHNQYQPINQTLVNILSKDMLLFWGWTVSWLDCLQMLLLLLLLGSRDSTVLSLVKNFGLLQ